MRESLLKIFVVASVLMTAFSVIGDNRAEKSFAELEKDVEFVLELIASRDLSKAEVRRATLEYYALFDNRCSAQCVENIQVNRDRVEPMRSSPGTPADLLARQYYSRTLYFSSTQSGSFIQALSDELDPVRVADKKSSRIMTEADIRGVMNLKRWVTSGGLPAHLEFSRDEIEAQVELYRRRYANNVMKLPFPAGLAAELWAGVLQNWRNFDAEQQRQVRTFFADNQGFPTMDVATYQILWGLDEASARDWKQTFTREQQYARLEYIQYVTMMGAVARGVSESEAYWRW